MYYRNIIHNSQKVEETQRSIILKKFFNVKNVVYLYSTLKTKEILTPDTTWMNPEDRMLSEISQARKSKYRYNDCRSRRSLEESNPRSQEVQGWVPGAGGGGLGVSV